MDEAQGDAHLVRLSYYPFLPAVRFVVAEKGPVLDSLLSSPAYEAVRERALERVRGALGDGIGPVPLLDGRDALLEILSVAVARMLAVLIGDRTLLQRYAAAEGRRVEAALANDADAESVVEVAAALGIPVEADGGWRLHFSHYIRNAPAEPEWKLIHRVVTGGFVTLTQPDLATLCRHALGARIVAELEAEKARPLAAVPALSALAERLAPELEEARAHWSEGAFGPVQPGLFPPCMKEIFATLTRGENLAHHARFAFATFLGTVGWNADQIMEYLATTPNFSREKSRYQIEHVTGLRGVDAYTPPGCATMQTHGICPLEKRDGLCFKIKHPLSYYRAKLRFQKREAEAHA
ncbi:MAG: hypothetical protein ACYDBQ_06645 [Thermoplasmatota archaeon]